MPRGCKPGQKTGGRKKGTPNVRTVARIKAAHNGIAMAQAQKITPLQILLTVTEGGEAAEKITERQFAAAVAAAPYCHPRLAAVQYVPPPDQGARDRRELLAKLSYQERQMIVRMLEGAATRSVEIDGKAEDDDG